MSDDAFRAQLDELAAGIKSRDKVVAHLTEFFRDTWDPSSEGPPDLATMKMPGLAFLLLLSDRWDDVVEYVQAIWDRMFNDVPTRGDDQPKLVIGSIHAIKLPSADSDAWELSLQVDREVAEDDDETDIDTGAVITHAFSGWEVTATTGAF